MHQISPTLRAVLRLGVAYAPARLLSTIEVFHPCAAKRLLSSTVMEVTREPQGDTKYIVYLSAPLEHSAIPEVTLAVADRLNLSMSKLGKLLAEGPGPLTKPTSAKVAERFAQVLREAGAAVRIEAVAPPPASAATDTPPPKPQPTPRTRRWPVALGMIALLAAGALLVPAVRGALIAFLRPRPADELALDGAAGELIRLRAQAEAGDAAAQYELGEYFNARGDREAALHWLRQAAAQGHLPAHYQLGQLYLELRDGAAALRELRAAAEGGVAAAQLRLGQLYVEGNSIAPDAAEARRWLTLAQQQGLSEAEALLMRLAAAGPSQALRETMAAVAELGRARGMALVPAPPELFRLAREGSLAELQAALVYPLDPNSRDAYGQTLLMYAASGNSPEVVSFLIGLGANVNAQSDAGWTALMYAARDNPQALSALLAAGADPTLAAADGLRAADLAAQHHPEFLALLQ